jgi:hypothetical protein
LLKFPKPVSCIRPVRFDRSNCFFEQWIKKCREGRNFPFCAERLSLESLACYFKEYLCVWSCPCNWYGSPAFARVL